MHNSQWITFSNQSCPVLYSLCANLLHSLIMWMIVSSLSPHNLHLLFFASLLFSFHIVLLVLFCAASRRDVVSFLRFSFLSLVQVFSSEILLVCISKLHTVVYLPIFVFLLFCSFIACIICIVFWSLKSVFLRAFLCNLQVILSIHRLSWMLAPPSKQTVYLRHLWDVWSLNDFSLEVFPFLAMYLTYNVVLYCY